MDDRFSHVFKDPRFQRVPLKERKLKIDKRFKGMFNDERFNLKYTIDKRGRPINSSTSENLQKYYQLSDDEEEEEEEIRVPSEDEMMKERKRKKLKEKKEAKKKKVVETKEEKLISDGVSGNSDERVISLNSLEKSSTNDSLIKIKETKTTEKTSIDEKTDLKGKRKLSLRDAELETGKKAKKKSRKEIEPEEEEDDEEEDETEDMEDDPDKDADGEGEEDVSGSEESEDSESGLGSGPDLARGIGNEESSSEDSDSDSESETEIVPSTAAEEIVHDWGEFDKDVALTTDLSRRLAVCNMDWDNITATDLFVVINSFKPPEGTVLSVKIYLSEFGKQRLEEESIKGPAELAAIAAEAKSSEDENSDNENDEGNSFHNEKLREYQLNRLKYYYAVAECDSIETSNHIYNELDGAEYESSKTCFDLRFIPDDMKFEDEDVKDSCSELPSKDVYQPNQFLTTALSEAEVALTWDETDKKRLETTTKNYNKKDEIKLKDFKDYIALSSEEDEEKEGSDASLISNSENDENGSESEDGGNSKSRINKYKKLLEGIEETERKEEEKQLEVTWEIGLKEKTEEVIKKKEKKKSSSPWDEFLDKMKEKRKKRKEKTKALKKTEEKKDETIQTFSDDVPSDVDFNDPYFKSELSTASKKKSKSQKKKERKEQLLKKLKGETDDYSVLTAEEIEEKKREKAALSLLMADGDDVNPKRHFDYEKILKEESKTKSKKKKMKTEKSKNKDDDFKLDVNDDRFNAIYSSSLFNIDRSAPEYKKSEAMEALIEEKMRRRYIEREDPDSGRKSKDNHPKLGTTPTESSFGVLVPSEPSSTSAEDSVNNLISSVKTKTKNFNFSKTKPNKKGVNWKKLPKDS